MQRMKTILKWEVLPAIAFQLFQSKEEKGSPDIAVGTG